MKPEFFEVFFRDGSYAFDFGFTAAHVRAIGGAMERAGFNYVEVGHGFGLGAARAGYPPAAETDVGYLKAAAETFKRTAYGVFFIPGVGNRDDVALAVEHGVRFISIGQNITAIGQAAPWVELCKGMGLHVTVCMMKAHLLSGPAFSDEVKNIRRWGADCVCIMDSAGTMTPKDVAARVGAVVAVGAAAGYHGHNNLGLAVANALSAADAGASRLDVSLGGLGRSAGNAPTELVAALLEKTGRRFQPGFDGIEPALAEVRRAGIPLPNAPDFTDILLGLYGLHSTIAPALNRAAADEGISRALLYSAVAEQNPVNPAESEIREIARRLSAK